MHGKPENNNKNVNERAKSITAVVILLLFAFFEQLIAQKELLSRYDLVTFTKI